MPDRAIPLSSMNERELSREAENYGDAEAALHLVQFMEERVEQYIQGRLEFERGEWQEEQGMEADGIDGLVDEIMKVLTPQQSHDNDLANTITVLIRKALA